jgi:hypothetical protein
MPQAVRFSAVSFAIQFRAIANCSVREPGSQSLIVSLLFAVSRQMYVYPPVIADALATVADALPAVAAVLPVMAAVLPVMAAVLPVMAAVLPVMAAALSAVADALPVMAAALAGHTADPGGHIKQVTTNHTNEKTVSVQVRGVRGSMFSPNML